MGLRVAVPLGKGALRVGVLLDNGHEDHELAAKIQIRPFVWPLERHPFITPELVQLAQELALRHATTPGQILATMLPPSCKQASWRLHVPTQGKKGQQILLRDVVARKDDDEQAALGHEWLQGNITMLAPKKDAATMELCQLQCSPPWPVRPGAVRQVKILEWLHEHGTSSRRTILQHLGSQSGTALDALIQNNHISLQQIEEDYTQENAPWVAPVSTLPFSLSAPQQTALDGLCEALDAKKAITKLLFGITGSGKTAVYLELARACLHRGRSIVIVAPEVALAVKLQRDAKAALPHVPLFFYHGYQHPSLRERIFRELATRTEPCVVVGTRSALFLPIPCMGAVVLDEEHDASFKQDDGLSYHAKEIAWFRTLRSDALLLLGSATPDIKTYQAFKEQKIGGYTLPARVGNTDLPTVRLVPLESKKAGLLAEESLKELRETVERGEQAVILLNRRGYAPLMVCLDCGKVMRCPHCDIGLTYHKGRERLVCHYCGHTVLFPTRCAKCQGTHYHPMGQGTERLEEDIVALLPPHCKVLRLDRDSTRRPGRMEEILDAFAEQKAQVLVGTQMLSKGHHFPNVTLAIVADGDMGLNMPDYRAAERTFQLLVQSAGRSGRGQKPGQVLIQTRDTTHYCWKHVQEADYEGFFAHELALRQKRRYPPFIHLGLIRISFPVDFADGQGKIQELSAILREAARKHDVLALGPAPAVLALLRNRKRFHCLLKSETWSAIRAVFNAVTAANTSAKMRISLDLDPVNML